MANETYEELAKRESYHRGTEVRFYFEPIIHDESIPFAVLTSGVTYPDPAYFINRTKNGSALRMMYTLEYVSEGEGVIVSPEGRVRVRAGETYLLNLRQECVYFSDPEKPLRKTWINFKGTAMDGLLPLFGLTEPVTVAALPREAVDEFFAAVELLAQFRTGGSHSSVTATVYRHLHRVLFDLAKAAGKATFPEKFSAASVRALIDTSPFCDLRMGEIARELGYSERQICRVFSAAYGMTPKRYILGKKVEHASRMLAETDRPIKEIADYLNFYDTRHFSTVFHAATGMTPAAWRRFARIDADGICRRDGK